MKIATLEVLDLRFPTSSTLDGSDAMNPAPDYSAAYVILRADGGAEGHGLTFTIGRGNEVVCAAVRSLASRVIGLEVEWIQEDPDRFWRHLTGDSQLRWIGPEKGAIHLATAAIVNAVWDLLAKHAGMPLWKLIASMSAEQLFKVMNLRYLSDVITESEALRLLQRGQEGKEERLRTLEIEGYPAYTTAPGWLGYSTEKLRRLAASAMDAGFTRFKLKVGGQREDDLARLAELRRVIGPDRMVLIDANQVWEVGEAIDWVNSLKSFEPYFIEEPTSPDDIDGHRKIRDAVAPVKVATGEMCENRIIFKQFISSGALDIAQVDVCRLGGLNETLSVMLLAAKYGVPVWPHGGGVGLCEYVQHISMIDYLVLSGRKDDHALEYVDHLHEHFVTPCIIADGNYRCPTNPGFSVTMKTESLARYCQN